MPEVQQTVAMLPVCVLMKLCLCSLVIYDVSETNICVQGTRVTVRTI